MAYCFFPRSTFRIDEDDGLRARFRRSGGCSGYYFHGVGGRMYVSSTLHTTVHREERRVGRCIHHGCDGLLAHAAWVERRASG